MAKRGTCCMLKAKSLPIFVGALTLAAGLVDQSNVWYPRLTAAMILSGSAVHAKGLGSSLVSFRKRLMAAWRSTIERKTPRLRRRLVNLAKKPSTALSQEAEVGV